MKKIFLILIFIFPLFANENLSTQNNILELKKDIRGDISELKKDIRENNKLLLEIMKSNQEATNKRFEDMNSKFNLLVTIMLGGFTIIMGYLIKERNSIKKDIKIELEEELTKKADKNLVEDIIKTLIKVSKDKKEYESILHKYHII